MSSQLTPDEVFTHAQQHRDNASQLMERRGRLQAELQQLRNGGASVADINEKNGEIQDTNSRTSKEIQMANDLDAKAILNILISTDVENAIDAINKASKQVKKAVEKINSIKRVLQYIDLFIRIGGAIVNAATTGTPAAQIKAIIEAIDILYKKDFPIPS